LRNEAAAAIQQILDDGRELGERADWQVPDDVGCGMTIDVEVSRDVERRFSKVLGANARGATKKKEPGEDQFRFDVHTNHEELSGAM
jgi:hypothetical protein